jgi:RHS repeat-associated protein
LIGFTGAHQLQDGAVHLAHRFHSTFTLGFTQPSPSRQDLNNYNYAACDPINNTDPTGLQNSFPHALCTGFTIWGAKVGVAMYVLATTRPVGATFTGILTVGALACAGYWMHQFFWAIFFECPEGLNKTTQEEVVAASQQGPGHWTGPR